MSYTKLSHLAKEIGVTSQTLYNNLKRLQINPLRTSKQGSYLLSQDEVQKMLDYMKSCKDNSTTKRRKQ